MDEDIAIMITATITMLGAMGTILLGLRMWLKSKADRLGAGAREELETLKDAVAQLRTDLDQAYGELSANQQELHERIDFAERLLSRGKGTD